MSICPNCGNQLPEGALFCNACGAKLDGQQAVPAAAPQPQPEKNIFDHTEEFETEDISKNKVFAMATYLLGWIGIFVALLAANKSEYAGFHVRQALKLTICDTLAGIVMIVLCWTFIVPAAAAIASGIIFVLRIISFINVCRGKAIEPAIVRKLGFLK